MTKLRRPWLQMLQFTLIVLSCPVQLPKNMLPHTATSWMVLFCSDISCGPFPAFSALSSRSDRLRRDENQSMHAWPGCWMMAGMITTSQLCLNVGAMYTPQPPQLSPFHGQDGDHPMNPVFLLQSTDFQTNPAISFRIFRSATRPHLAKAKVWAPNSCQRMR